MTNRQRQVVRLLADGLSCAEVALELAITDRMVRRHVAAVAARLEGKGGPAAKVRKAARHLLAA